MAKLCVTSLWMPPYVEKVYNNYVFFIFSLSSKAEKYILFLPYTIKLFKFNRESLDKRDKHFSWNNRNKIGKLKTLKSDWYFFSSKFFHINLDQTNRALQLKTHILSKEIL